MLGRRRTAEFRRAGAQCHAALPQCLGQLIIVTALVAISISCVSTKLPPISQTGADFRPLRSESRLWQESRDEERLFLRHVYLYRDSLLEDYLETIVSALNPRGMASNPEITFQVRVLGDSDANAWAYPHGTIYVTLGLLALAENEHQLAAILGHEMSHVEYRHTLRHQRRAGNQRRLIRVSTVAIVVGLLGLGAPSDTVTSVYDVGMAIASIAAAHRYGYDLEVEADRDSLEKMMVAAYDIREASKIFREIGGPSVSRLYPDMYSRLKNLELTIEILSRLDHGPDVLRPIDPLTFKKRIGQVTLDDVLAAVTAHEAAIDARVNWSRVRNDRLCSRSHLMDAEADAREWVDRADTEASRRTLQYVVAELADVNEQIVESERQIQDLDARLSNLKDSLQRSGVVVGDLMMGKPEFSCYSSK